VLAHAHSPACHQRIMCHLTHLGELGQSAAGVPAGRDEHLWISLTSKGILVIHMRAWNLSRADKEVWLHVPLPAKALAQDDISLTPPTAGRAAMETYRYPVTANLLCQTIQIICLTHKGDKRLTAVLSSSSSTSCRSFFSSPRTSFGIGLPSA